MTSFFAKNWDKILGFVISIIFAGLVGFFSALRAIDSQISTISGRIVTLETESSVVTKPALESIKTYPVKFEQIDVRFQQIEKENDIHKATYNMLSLTREEERRRTINSLKELLDE